MRSSLRAAFITSFVLIASSVGCQQEAAPSPAAREPEPDPAVKLHAPNPDALAFQGHWEGTVGGQRMRAEPERVRMEPLGELGLFSFGIGCRVPYELDARGPFEGTPRTCVLALQADAQEYALMFAEPPNATLTLTKGGIEIELRGVEDDTGQPVQLRFTGDRVKDIDDVNE